MQLSLIWLFATFRSFCFSLPRLSKSMMVLASAVVMQIHAHWAFLYLIT